MKNSLKRSTKTKLSLLASIVLLLASPACDDPNVGPDTSQKKGNYIPEETFEIGPAGGIIKALDGHVVIDIPQGALLTTEHFTVSEGPQDDGEDFIIKSILIKPRSVVFTTPAKLRLRYDGQLSLGIDPCKAKCLAIYHFKNDVSFDKRKPSDMMWLSQCHVNTMDQCIEAEIYTGGVFAIGEASLGQSAQQPK